MRGPKPPRGTDAYREYILDAMRSAAADLGLPVREITRDKLKRWSRDTEGPAIHNDDLASIGPFASLKTLAQAYANEHPDMEPSRADLGQRRQVQRQSSYVRKLERLVGDEEWITRKIRNALADAVERHPPVIREGRKFCPPTHSVGQRAVVAFLSDTHWGADVDPEEVPGGGYNWQIAARRLGHFVREVAAYKIHRRENTPCCHLLLGGDMIAGTIHMGDAGIRMLAEQMHGARWVSDRSHRLPARMVSADSRVVHAGQPRPLVRQKPG